MVSDNCFLVIAKFIFQSTCLIGFDEDGFTNFHKLFQEHFLHKTIFVHARDILSFSGSLAPYKYIPCHRRKQFCSLYCCFVFLCLGKLPSLISTLHSGYCTLKATLEIDLFRDELLFLTIFGSSDVLVERENNSFFFGDYFCWVGLENNTFSSGDLLFSSNDLFSAVENDSFVQKLQ